MAYTVTLIPGDGIGPEVVQRHRSHPGSHRRQVRVGEFRRRRRGLREVQGIHPQRTDRVDRAHPARAQRPGHDADRRRLLQHQRRAAQEVRAVRQLPADPQPARCAHALSRRRSHRRSRKHRGPVLRHRARSCARRGREPEDHHREGLDAHLQVRLRICAQVQAQEDPRHPQSQHHEDVGWPVHPLLAQRLARTIPRSPTASTSWTTPACSW